MKVLLACEESQAVTIEFRKLGDRNMAGHGAEIFVGQARFGLSTKNVGEVD